MWIHQSGIITCEGKRNIPLFLHFNFDPSLGPTIKTSTGKIVTID